jgi:hypothetical protein
MTDDEDVLDEDGYPTAVALEKIRAWEISGPESVDALWAFVRSLWYYPDYFSPRGNGYWDVSTGGWSGNEDVIVALSENFMFWSLCWYSGRRGGHYVFHIRFPRASKQPEKAP